MKLPDIRMADLEGKRVLMRVDFNVEFENGKPKELHKIKAVKDTLDFVLSKKGVKVSLLSHLGRPEKKSSEFSFRNFYKEIGIILERKPVFVSECVGGDVKKAMEKLEENGVLMLENVRFYREDEMEDAIFAGKLAENFDIYVNEAFGVSHRRHSSLVKIAEILPSFAGINLIKETEELANLREKFKKPAVAIIGGAKIETKVPLIDFFSKNYDQVLVGGKLGLEAEKQGLVFSENVFIPVDYLGNGLDIGPQTVDKFGTYIKEAKTILWNGPLGKFENPEFKKGTVEVLGKIILNKEAFKVAGGGETVQVLEEGGWLNEFDFVSTGGGAMLEFLVKGTLPALEALKH